MRRAFNCPTCRQRVTVRGTQQLTTEECPSCQNVWEIHGTVVTNNEGDIVARTEPKGD